MVRIGNKKLPVALFRREGQLPCSEVLVYVENDAVSVNAKGKDAIEASVANVEQIGFKKYLTLNLNYTEDENADKTPKTVFVNVPTNMDIEEGAVLKVALNRYKVLSAETRKCFESEK